MSIPVSPRHHARQRHSRRPTSSPISVLTHNTSIRATIFGSRCAASFIHEFQNLNASFANGLAFNPNNTLNEARAYASLAYGNNNRVVFTGQYFSTWGTLRRVDFRRQANFSPNSNGWIAEIAYIPFISSLAPGWPWFNMRVGVQYTWYTEFNGTSAGATGNNTLFLYAWFAI